MDKGHALFKQIITAHQTGATTNIDQLIEQVYQAYRPAFLNWAQNEWRVSNYYASEVYQKTIVIFYLNIKSGKLHTLTSNLKTYLFGIGKRVMFELKREDKASIPYDEIPLGIVELDTGYLEREEANHRHQLVESLLMQLSERCRMILDLFYFRSFSMEAIAERMNYNSVDVAKKSKYECMKRLRKFAEGNSLVL